MSNSQNEKPRRKVNKIPLDRQRVKEGGDIWGRQFLNEIPVDKNGVIIYTITKPDFTLDFRFKKKEAKELKKLLKVKNGSQDFSLGRRASRLWYSLIVIAAEQGNGTRGSFTIGDIVRLWGCEKSGRLYSDIRKTFISLALFSPRFSNNKSGDDKLEWGYTFISEYFIKGEGERAEFHFTLNDMALGITTEWLKDGELSKKAQKGGYLSIPVSELKEKRVDPGYENFRERLRLLKNGTIEIKFFTILDDWIKVGDDTIRHRKKCYDLVLKYLGMAEKDKELKGFEYSVLDLKNWKESWKVKIRK